MKAFLLFCDRDFDPEAPLVPLWEALVQDLELDPIFTAMADGDEMCIRDRESASRLQIVRILHRFFLRMDTLSRVASGWICFQRGFPDIRFGQLLRFCLRCGVYLGFLFHFAHLKNRFPQKRCFMKGKVCFQKFC